MGFHTFDPAGARGLEDESRYQYLSVDELLALFDPRADQRVVDLGSGTGFYTDAVAPYVETVYAIDAQPEMHGVYHEKGHPANVDLVTAIVSALPFKTDALDAAFSTMTYHEFASDDSLAEIARVLAPGGNLAIADWSAAGAGERGPPTAERFDAATVATHLRDHGFEIQRATDRRETLVVAARLSTW
jgi:ubiquinone/menaquinone biosynthesis C-methylase UbiE